MQRKLIQLHKLLIKKNLTLSTAESCTAGLLAVRLTDIPGSSRFFITGMVTYSNRAKTKILGINPKLIKAYGAVSQEVALAMARSMRIISRTDLGIAITGIAGPAGASKNKPVGLVYIAIADKYKARSWQQHFRGNRKQIRNKAALKAMQLLLQWIQ
jgi:nicotinamide-nucleotide amidase